MPPDIGRAIALLLTCPAAVILPGLLICVLIGLCLLSIPMLFEEPAE